MVSLAGVAAQQAEPEEMADSDGPRVGPSYHRATDVRWTGGGLTDKVCLALLGEIL